jgi:hypothetical protein
LLLLAAAADMEFTQPAAVQAVLLQGPLLGLLDRIRSLWEVVALAEMARRAAFLVKIVRSLV